MLLHKMGLELGLQMKDKKAKKNVENIKSQIVIFNFNPKSIESYSLPGGKYWFEMCDTSALAAAIKARAKNAKNFCGRQKKHTRLNYDTYCGTTKFTTV